ncbi:MAG: transketolase, partial [Erysipelothrix sp.]|nr:transketolase [Erysipelothrix sp.]
MENITKNAVNAIRVLSMDGVQQANSGHPGLPLGAAPMAYELWAHHLKHNPKNPQWTNRDRFILSAGHGSMLIYSLLHLFGYDLPIEELKNFRQWNSKTPGHPEFRHTVGVETTTGPLGAGLSNAVGMAMAEAHLASIFNRPGYPVVDHYTYAIAGDGCMMEGVASEAMSLAGHLGLGKLIVLYDSNRITIEGSTDLAFSENVEKRFESYGFQVIEVADGNRLSKIARAIEQAKEESDRPTLITIKTEIGFGSPKQGSEKAHGEPLGLENITKTRQTLEWDESEPFKISDEIYAHFDQLALRGDAQEKEHQTLVENYRKEYPELAKLWEEYNRDIPLEELVNNESYWEHEDKAIATRSISGTILNKLKEDYPQLIGGSADLAPSTKTEMVNEGSFQKES